MKVIHILSLASLAFALIPSVAQAQPFDNAQGPLTPDNSLGEESSIVTPVNPTRDRIDGGAARGGNLFHSFGEFNVDAGRSVYFANPPAIENILTRVTGGNQSDIMGTLGVLGDANLFLINPSGILFGPSARLDIRGSFFATTGDGIKLGENGLFSATDLEPSKLLHVRPEALFTNALINHMAKLNNRGNLAVGTGSALVLHGGEVRNSGSLTAPGGTVMVLGERIGLLDDARLDVSSATGGGNVFIGGFLGGRGNIPTAGRTYIGPDVRILADALETGDGGNVIVWASEVTRFHGNISARGGLYGGDGGFVEVSGARRLIFRGEVDTTAALGKAGTLLLDPRNIVIANGEPSMEISDAQTVPSDIFNTSAALSDHGAVGDTEEVWSLSEAEVTLYESQLEGLSGDTNVVLQATNDIVVEDLSDNSISLARGTGDITFIADADGDGAGDFSMADPADTINTNGRNIAITGANLTLGNIDTSLPAPDGAGELLTTAAVVSTGPGEQLENLSGNLFGSEDVDLYQIYLTGEGTFSATTIDGSNVDTQLFLFDRDGLGVYGNDDNRAVCNCPQSTLPARDPLTPTAPGIYYLGINVFGVNPVSDHGDIFAAATTSNLLEPTGGGGGLPLVGWENVGGDGLGDYTINLTGVEGPSTTFAEALDNTVISNSGAITLTATNGNITAGDLNAASFSGAAGEIRIDAAADIVLEGSIVDASGVVGGRDITLNSGGTISLNNSVLTASTNGRGDAGKVTMTAEIDVRFSGGGAFSRVNSSGEGDAGGIEITTGTLDVTDGALLSASTLGEGAAGKIEITATGSVLFAGENSQGFISGAFSRVEPDAVGSSGGIEITTGTLDVTDGARLSAATLGEGGAGKIEITATGRVLFSGESTQGFSSGAFSTVQPDAVGSSGGIEITTGTLDITDGAWLSAVTLGEGAAGNIEITATGRVLFSGESTQGFPSGAFSTVEPDAVGSSGEIEITTGTLDVTDGALLATATLGVGDAGDLTIAASEAINISGLVNGGNYTGLFASTASEAVGETGDIIIISTPILNLGNAGVINAITRNDSRGGDIEINTNRLSVTGGAQILSSSFSSGSAGTISIDATEQVRISGIDPSYNSRVADRGEDVVYTTGPESAILSNALSTGTAGTVTLETNQLQVSSGALLSVSSKEGIAGSLNLTASEINLNNGTFSAETASGDQGNITIDAPTLVLRNNSEITTNATGTATGGNITISTENLVARDDSDISANAIDGRGGNISITASGVFLDTESEITATSENNIDGTVEIQAQINSGQGLVPLNSSPIDASSLISKGCEEYRGSEFIITGRGGIPPHPFETLPGEVIWLDWRALTDENSSLGYRVPDLTSESEVRPLQGEQGNDEIRQAQGWVQLPDGTVVLTAYPVKMTPAGPVMQHPGCQIILGDSSQ